MKTYKTIFCKGHPKQANGVVREHILIAEQVLGKYLPQGVVIHHYKHKHDNRALVICQNAAYHFLLHRRLRALKECSHADWRKCRFCKQYDSIQNLYISPDNYTIHHYSCAKNYRQINKARYRELNQKYRRIRNSGRCCAKMMDEPGD